MNRWNRNKAIAGLKEIARRLNHSPSAKEAGPILYQASRRYCGSFNRAKKFAGLTITPFKHHRVNKNAIILNEDLAYILGVKRGDGYWRKRITPQRTSREIGFNVKNLDFAKEFKRRLKR